MPIKAGSLDRRVTLLRRISDLDASGGPDERWDEWQTVWAGKRDLSGREFIAAQQVNAEITTEFVIRHLAGVTPEMRLQEGDLEYDILSIGEIGLGEGLRLQAAARAGDVVPWPPPPALRLEDGGFLVLNSGGRIVLQ